jgi:hypothetical protein
LRWESFVLAQKRYRTKPVVFGKTAEKSEVLSVRGGAEMGRYDSLWGSDEKPSAAKSKAPGKKDDID